MDWDGMLGWVTAAGGVGTAAMGFVQALKAVRLGGWGGISTFGLGRLKRTIGAEALGALHGVYGKEWLQHVLPGAWCQGSDDVGKLLRNGLRMAVFGETSGISGFVQALGHDWKDVQAAVALLRAGHGDPAALAAARERLARLEAAVDARVAAAVSAGRDAHVSGMQLTASVVAVGGSLLVWTTLPEPRPFTFHGALAIGLLAVPVAPVAKDVVSLLTSLRASLSARRPGA